MFFSSVYNFDGGNSFFTAFVYYKPTAFLTGLTSTLKMPFQIVGVHLVGHTGKRSNCFTITKNLDCNKKL
jgi:hypothetical protein